MSDGTGYHQAHNYKQSCPDPSKEYHLFMDASNHTWSGVLTQQWSNSEISSDEELTYHPITYQSGTFSTSQLKWSTIMKECYAIMMCFQNMVLYLWGAEIVLRSYHAPLEKLINKEHTNSKLGIGDLLNYSLYHL